MSRASFIRNITGQGRLDATLMRILAHVASLNRVHIGAMQGRSRAQHLSTARREFIRLAQISGYSTKQIGASLSRDHTTILQLSGRNNS
jgi:chromosomal replication initiation ATPase DnaA